MHSISVCDPYISVQPTDALNSALGSTVMFGPVEVTGTAGSFSNFWKKDGSFLPAAGTARISGTRTNTLTITSLEADDIATYELNIFGGGFVGSCGFSNEIEITICKSLKY